MFGVLFSELAIMWLELYKKGIVKNNSYLGTYYNPVMNHLIPYFGDKDINSILHIHVQIFFRSIENDYALETLKKYRASLKAIFDCGVENGFCKSNPVTKTLRIKSSIKPHKRRTYQEDQYKKIWSYALSHPLGLSILLLMELGISRSELLGIRWQDIDLEQRSISIVNGTVSQKNVDTGRWEIVTDGLKTEYRERVLPISKTLAALIAATPRSKSGFLIASPRGKVYEPQNWYKRVYKVFMRDLRKFDSSLPCLTPHEMRHTRATFWVDSGLNLLDVAYLGGWTDMKMLRKRYYHINLTHLQERLDRLQIT